MQEWQAETVLPGSGFTAGRIFYILSEPFGGVFTPPSGTNGGVTYPAKTFKERDKIPFWHFFYTAKTKPAGERQSPPRPHRMWLWIAGIPVQARDRLGPAMTFSCDLSMS